MLNILGRATSSNVQTVMWLVGEIGLKHKREDYGGTFGRTQTPEYLAMNPMGRVPVIQDDDVTMFESQAILRYLAAKHGAEHLWPQEAAARAPIDQWMEWAKVNFFPVFTYKVFWQLVRTSKADRDHALVDAGTAEIAKLMPIAEQQIKRHGWLAGDSMSLADFSFGTHLYRYYNIDFDRPDLPGLSEYYAKLMARPAYAAHAMVSFEGLRVEGA